MTSPSPTSSQIDGDQERSASLWTQLGCPYEAALALLGSREEDALREALQILTDLGATATAGWPGRTMREAAVSGPSRRARAPRPGPIHWG